MISCLINNLVWSVRTSQSLSLCPLYSVCLGCLACQPAIHDPCMPQLFSTPLPARLELEMRTSCILVCMIAPYGAYAVFLPGAAVSSRIAPCSDQGWIHESTFQGTGICRPSPRTNQWNFSAICVASVPTIETKNLAYGVHA